MHKYRKRNTNPKFPSQLNHNTLFASFTKQGFIDDPQNFRAMAGAF